MRERVSIVLLATAAAIAGCDRGDDNIADESTEMPPPSVVIANDQRAAEVVGPDDESAETLTTDQDATGLSGNQQ